MAEDDRKTQVTIRLAPSLLQRMQNWQDAQTVPPDRTSTIEAALKLFLSTFDTANGPDAKP